MTDKTYIIRFSNNTLQIFNHKQDKPHFQLGSHQYEVNSNETIEMIPEYFARDFEHTDLKEIW